MPVLVQVHVDDNVDALDVVDILLRLSTEVEQQPFFIR